MTRSVLLIGLVAALLLAPYLVPAGWVAVLSKMLIAALFALAFNLLAGQAGMLSFGHATYFAAGTFATLHIMQAVENGLALPTPLLPVFGAVAGLLTGAVCGSFATLRSGVYFSMITLAIAELFHSLAPSLGGLFGGEAGLSSMRMPWLWVSFGTDRDVYFLVLAWTAIAVCGLNFYLTTPLGRLTIALRENEQRARFLGFDTYRTKVVIFSLSAMVSGLAGGLLAIANESANYVLLETGVSASVVLNAFIGGAGVFFGPALGAVLLTGFSYAVSDLTRMLLLYQGAIFIVVMIYAPQGLGGMIASHAAPMREGWWRRLIGPYLRALVPIFAISLGVIFAVELAQRFFAFDYISLADRTGTYPPVEFAGRSWAPFSPLTWAAPVLLLAIGAALVRPSAKLVRQAWEVGAR